LWNPTLVAKSATRMGHPATIKGSAGNETA
jgi:hypothetical protein